MAEKLEALTSSPASYIEASSWNVISQASPTAISLNPNTIQAYSNNQSYDSSSGGLKTLVFFQGGLPAGTYLFMPWGMGATCNVAASGTIVIGTSGSGQKMALNVRVRPHSALWTPAAKDWNNFFSNGPSHGSDVVQTSLNAMLNTGGSVNLTSMSFDAQLPPLMVFSAGTIWGLTIDCEPVENAGSDTITSIVGQISAAVPIATAGVLRHIYGVKIAA